MGQSAQAHHAAPRVRTWRSRRVNLAGRRWQRLRAEALANQGYRCGRCGNKATAVHHLDPVSEGHPVLCGLDRLLAVCSRCHAWYHGNEYRRRWIEVLAELDGGV